MKAILYARFSPRPKDKEVDCKSIETQLEICREYCRKKEHEIVGEYQDRALSGGEENRPGLWTALQSLRQGWVLVAYKLDRLARNVYLSEVIQRQVRKKQATIEIVEGMSNGDSPEDQMIRQILQVFSEYERKVIGARTKAALLRYQAAGKRICSKACIPWGTMLDPGDDSRIVPNLEEMAITKEIHRLAVTGLTMEKISQDLNLRRIPCRGHRWNRDCIRRVMGR